MSAAKAKEKPKCQQHEKSHFQVRHAGDPVHRFGVNGVKRKGHGGEEGRPAVLEQALARVQEEYRGSGRAEIFEHLRIYLSSEASPGDYDTLAPKLAMSPNALGVAVHRLRQRYRECIRLELAQTVAGPQELEEEMNYLFTVLSA